MARPAFMPDRTQQRLIHALGRQKQRMAEADVRFTELIAEADRAGVPIEWIARASEITVKTVYARLAKASPERTTALRP